MKNKLILLFKKIIMYSLFGLVSQGIFCGILLAVEVAIAQENVSVRDININLKFSGNSIISVIKKIELETDYTFVYSKRKLDKNVKISGDYIGVSLYEVLLDISRQSNLAFQQFNNNITVKNIGKVKEELLEPNVEVLQGRTITGKVTDENDEGLPGVNVIVKGTVQGTVTDVEGNYSLEVPEDATLVFSSVGFVTEEIIVGDRAIIDIALVPDITALDEIVVVAYGQQKKESVLASIATIEPAELKVPSSNLTTALAGRMAGIISYQRSGEPGQDNAEFFIRGVTTFGYKKDPLILIDGVELSADDLARLQPDDIQSFSIMKDATATALYGARGANGVILVTTKEGVEGKAKVSVRFENSFSAPTQEVELVDPITYMYLHNEAVRTRNPLGVLPYSYEKIERTEAGANPIVYPVTDWQSELFKDYTSNQRLNFNISGGGKIARYYIAATANQDNGILKVDKKNNFNNNIDLKRYLVRSNININITESTEAVVRLHATIDDYTGPIDGGTGVYNKVMRTNPVYYPPYYPADEANKFTNHILFGNTGDGKYLNPYADMVKGYKDYSETLVLAQFELKQDLSFITEGLKARFLGSSNRYSFFDVSRFYNPYYYEIGFYDKINDTYTLTQLNPDGGTEYLNYSEGEKKITSTTYMELAANYDRTFNERHGVSGLVVYILREQLLANAGDLQKSLPYRNQGVSGRFTYSYDNKYFAEFNFGYNGSERFAKKERFGFFPSVGFGWIVSNERFFHPLSNAVSNLKLRVTHGLVGNDAIGSADDRFYYLSNVNMNDGNKGYTFGSNFNYSKNGVSISRYADDGITWETATKSNIGLEMGLFNKMDIMLDLFHEHRTNILMDRESIPTTMGLQAGVRANVGEALGRGIDASVDYHLLKGKFWLTARGNYTYATSEFKVKEEVDYSATPWKSAIGQNLSQTWGYVAERLFIDDEEVANSPTQFGEYAAGDIKYKDINNDGRITELDQVPIGYPTTPEIVYGAGFSMGYKEWDLSCFFQGLARESFWIDAKATAPFVDVDDDGAVISNNALLEVWADSHWSEETRDVYALWPRLSDRIVDNNIQTNTWFMRDGSFLRLKSAELGYSLPTELIDRYGVSRLRFYASGTNLLTFSKFSLWDPEMGSNGLGYPVQRVLNLGVQVQF
ncbi:MAG: TonB-dependent receptor [Cytophagales bacterium]|nr:TonB-dependent receptor [Cytophagales bacterium]